MSKIDMVAVAELREHYLDTVKKRPGLYRSTDTTVTVVLSKDLLEYSNAAAGHSGFGAGARPVGIRRAVKNSDAALAEIFESNESLAEFILGSECDGPAYVDSIRRKQIAAQDPPAAKVFWERYGKDDMQRIVKKFGRKRVEEAYKTATIKEFAESFELEV